MRAYGLRKQSLAQLCAQRKRARMEGMAPTPDQIALWSVLDAIDWESLLASDPWLNAMLHTGVHVAQELLEAADIASRLNDAAVVTSTLLDCGAQHGISSLLAWHLMAEEKRYERIIWIDRDASCPAARHAMLVRRPVVQFVCTDVLSQDFNIGEYGQCDLLCVRVCKAWAVMQAMFNANNCVRVLLLYPCCEDDPSRPPLLLCK